jgi:hypothetical protein
MRDDNNPTLPPADVLEAIATIHIGVEEPGPTGGMQRIVSRTNSAAFDETARRIARKKARAVARAQILF